jgi:hypothetical protein
MPGVRDWVPKREKWAPEGSQLDRHGIIDGIDRGLPASVWQTSVHAPGLKTPESRAATRVTRLTVLPSPSHNKVGVLKRDFGAQCCSADIVPTSYCTDPMPRPDELSLGRRAQRIGQYASAHLGHESPP